MLACGFAMPGAMEGSAYGGATKWLSKRPVCALVTVKKGSERGLRICLSTNPRGPFQFPKVQNKLPFLLFWLKCRCSRGGLPGFP